jgi:tetratricopeptide (TPR) repeat protein
MHDKRFHLVVTISFAVAGLIFALLGLYGIIGIPSFPGIWLLSLFFTGGEIGHGIGTFVLLTNPVLYALVGYIISLLSKSRLHLFVIVGLLLSTLLLSSLYFEYIKPMVRHSNHINQLKQQALDKLQTNPNDIYSLHWMGVHHFTRTGDNQQAGNYFRKIVDSEMEHDGTLFQHSLIYLAIIYQYQGKLNMAEECYSKFIKTSPDFKTDIVLLNYNNRYLKAATKRSSYAD